MTAFSFIIELKRTLPETAWPWLIAALRQDRTVWDSLQGEFGQRVLAELGEQAEAFSPAVLCLLAIGFPDPVEAVRNADYHQVPEPVFHPTGEADLWDCAPDLRKAGMQALNLIDQLNDVETWQEISFDREDVSPTTFACLYTLLPDPLGLLTSLINGGNANLAIHAFLSAPIPLAGQVDRLTQLVDCLPIKQCFPFIKMLYAHRPSLAVSMAQTLLQSSKMDPGAAIADIPLNGLGLHAYYDQINSLLVRSEVLRLAAQPKLAIPILNETIQIARCMQAQLSARLAQAAAEDEDRQSCLSAWEQASRLDPESLNHLGGLLVSLIDDNRHTDALIHLNEHPHQTGTLLHQPSALRFARARLALSAGEPEVARRHAEHALNMQIQSHVASGTPLPYGKQPLLDLARLFLDLSTPRQAIRAIQMALDINPADVEAVSLLARSQSAAGQFQPAIGSAHLAVGLAPERIDLCRQLALILEAGNEWLAAFTERSSLIERLAHPAPQDWYELAASALPSGQAERAIQICDQLLTADQTDGIACALRGEALAALDKFDEAIEQLDQATQLIPDHPAPWLALARVYQSHGEAPRALETLRAASQAAPDQAEILLALGEACLEDNAPSQALSYLRKAHSLVNENRNGGKDTALGNRIALRLGQTLFHLGHLEEACQHLEQAYQVSPYHPEIAYSYARALLAMDNPRPALAPLQAVLSTEPGDPGAYLDFAHCVLNLDGRVEPEYYQMALHYLGRAMELSPELPEARALSAEIMAASGDLLPAVSAYRKALETRLSEDAAWRMRLWLGLGKVALDLGQTETAVAALQEASQAGPQSPDVHRFLCEAYQSAGLADNAYESAQTALDLAPEDIDMLIWFAQKVYDLQCQPGVHLAETLSEAVKALEKASQLVPDQGSLLIRLGQAQMQIGECHAAQISFHRLTDQLEGDVPGFAVDATAADLHNAAQGLLNLGDPSGAVVCLERALQIHQNDSRLHSFIDDDGLPDQISLLTSLVGAYQKAGQRLAALQALEQAIQLDKGRKEFYIKKAELLLQTEDGQSLEEVTASGRTDLALLALETAADIVPDDPEIHIQMALVQRILGNLPAALERALNAIHIYARQEQPDSQAIFSPLSGSLLPADLARSLLQFDNAAALLDACPDCDATASLSDRLEYHCLRAELALEMNDTGLATHQIARAVELSPDDPGLLALQARLSLRKGELPIAGFANQPSSPAVDIYQLALEGYSKSTSRADDDAPPVWELIDRRASTRRRLAEAALDLRLWAAAFRLAEETAKSCHVEPHAHLNLARALVLRAEQQRLCRSLDVVSHAPGEEALSEEAFRSFIFSMQNAEAAILDQAGEIPEACADTLGQLSVDPYCLLKRWQARGMAVFAPNTQSAEALAALPRHPEDVMAEIACLSETGDLLAAGKSASTYSHNPFVLAQLALALSESKPRQALAAAHAAIDGLVHPEEDSQTHPLPGEILLRRNDTPMLYALLARLTHKHGNPLEDSTIALQAIQKALKYWPDESHWHTLAAKIYLSHLPKDGQAASDSAISHLEQAIRFAPDFAEPYILLGQIYAQRSVTQKSIELLEIASEMTPDDVQVWLLLAQAHQSAGNVSEAAECAEKTIHLAPSQVAPLLLRGEIALDEGQPKSARSHAQAALDLEPENASALLLMSRALQALNQPGDAIELLEKALPNIQAPLPLHLEHIQLIREARGAKAALQTAHELSERFPEEPRVLSELAKTLAEDGQLEAAIHTAQRALRSNTSLDSQDANLQASLHYQLGSLLSQAGHLDQAIHNLVEAIHSNPDFIDPYLELGRVHQQRRQHSLALNTFNQAIAAAPNDARPYYHAGVALKENKDYLEAEKMLRRACELAPDDVSIHRLLGAVVTLNMVHNHREAAVVN